MTDDRMDEPTEPTEPTETDETQETTGSVSDTTGAELPPGATSGAIPGGGPAPQEGPHTGVRRGAPGRRAERLHRSRDGRIVAGVADGLADYFDVDTTLVRVAFVALALAGGVAVPLYLAGWLLIPEEGTDHSMAEEFLGHHPAL